MFVLKTCTRCKEDKLINEFSTHPHSRFGVQSRCKKCYADIARERREKMSKEQLAEINKRNYEKHKAKRREHARIKASERYYSNHEEELKKRKEWRLKNKHLKSLQDKRYREKKKKDPVWVASQKARNCVKNAFTRKKISKGSKSEKIIGCDYEFLKKYIERQFEKGMSWDNTSEWHIDHIIPLATAKTEEDVIRLNHYTNLRPLWAKDNLSKGAKIEEHQVKIRF